MYFAAATVVDDAIKKKGSLKNLVFSSPFKNKKALYALTCETLRYRKLLLDVAADCGILKDKTLRNKESLVAVLMYEHLLGKALTGKYKITLQKYKSSIHSRCERLKVECRVTDLKQAFHNMMPSLTSDKALPKYVRINTLVTQKEDVVRKLQEKFKFQERLREDMLLDESSKDWCVEDEHIPNLFTFHHAVEFHTDPLYMSGRLIIQDKASCFPAFILNPPAGSTVIDCCAAPGNKTTHLAAIMNNIGKVYAFDKDNKRLSTLKRLVNKAGATCVCAECKDFLSVDPFEKKYDDVEYILVDPSCSGSGMVNRQQHLTDQESCTSERLQQLAKFQISILKHALTFPRVKKVVYSTCSVHEEENEMVVEEVYKQVSDTFDIENIMPDWNHRGHNKYMHGRQCLRMSYEECMTNGFFVACFVRKCNIISSDKNKQINHTELTNKRTPLVCSRGSKSKNSSQDRRNRKKCVKMEIARLTSLKNTVQATTSWQVVNQAV